MISSQVSTLIITNTDTIYKRYKIPVFYINVYPSVAEVPSCGVSRWLPSERPSIACRGSILSRTQKLSGLDSRCTAQTNVRRWHPHKRYEPVRWLPARTIVRLIVNPVWRSRVGCSSCRLVVVELARYRVVRCDSNFLQYVRVRPVSHCSRMACGSPSIPLVRIVRKWCPDSHICCWRTHDSVNRFPWYRSVARRGHSDHSRVT